MILNEFELNNTTGGSIRNVLLIGIGSAISFVVGVFSSFFKSC